ncbi:hypothetical protein ACLMJK_001136 [Lecanora helva]
MDDQQPDPRFTAVLSQLKVDMIPEWCSSIRLLQNSDYVPCNIVGAPLSGSYNIIYRIHFIDGLQWAFKIPAHGHKNGWIGSAPKGLLSEVKTMQLITRCTTIPLPTVHHYDCGEANDIGCPYILMDFLEGKPLYKVWFNNQIPQSQLEVVRARILQNLASAMVELSRFQVDAGGALSFDEDGNAIGIESARTPDFAAMDNMLLEEEDPDIYCQKGPIDDPAAHCLFMLDRCSPSDNVDNLRVGMLEALRKFIELTLKHICMDGKQFCLAHPDFDSQNILIKDDGTLSGIIDWDGAGTVPNIVGPLAYPKFLLKDGEPGLEAYRAMYAQFIETAIGQKAANITRASIIAANLTGAADYSELIPDLLKKIFWKMESLAPSDIDSDEEYDTGSFDEEDESNSQEYEEDDEEDEEIEEEDEEEYDEDSEKDGSERDEGNISTPPTDLEESRSSLNMKCPKCVAEALQSQNIMPTVPVEESVLKHSDVDLRPNNVSTASGDILRAPPESYNIYVARSIIQLIGKGCGSMVEGLHCKEPREANVKNIGNPRIDRIPAGKGLFSLGLKNMAQDYLNCLAVGTRQMTEFLHVDEGQTAKAANGSTELPAERTHSSHVGPQTKHQEARPAVVMEKTKHAKDCAKATATMVERQKDAHAESTPKSTEQDIKEAWSRIALEAKNCGIRDSTIMANKPKIAGLIIDAMRAEQKRKDQEDEKAKMVKRKAEKKAKHDLKAQQACRAREMLASQKIEHQVDEDEQSRAVAPEEKVVPQKDGLDMPSYRQSAARSSEKASVISNTRNSTQVQGDTKGPYIAKSRLTDTMENQEKKGVAQQATAQLPKDSRSASVSSAEQAAGEQIEDPVEVSSEALAQEFERQIASSKVKTPTVESPKLLNTEPVHKTSKPSIDLVAEVPRIPSATQTNTQSLPGPVQSQTPLTGAEGKPPARNKPCPCGSKHKYKKCCGRKQEIAEPEDVATQGTSVGTIEDRTLANLTTSNEAKADQVNDLEVDLEDMIREIRDGFNLATSAPKPTDAPSGVTAAPGLPKSKEKINTTNPPNALQKAHEPSQPALNNNKNAPVPNQQRPDGGVDNGGFTMTEVCIALGKGTLDREREERMDEGFRMLLMEVMGGL